MLTRDAYTTKVNGGTVTPDRTAANKWKKIITTIHYIDDAFDVDDYTYNSTTGSMTFSMPAGSVAANPSTDAASQTISEVFQERGFSVVFNSNDNEIVITPISE